MTLAQKIEWLRAHTLTFEISVNEHRAYYETLETYFARPEYEDDVSADVKAECIARDVLFEVQCYPQTPIGFYRVTHFDLEKAVDRTIAAVAKELRLPVPNESGGEKK